MKAKTEKVEKKPTCQAQYPKVCPYCSRGKCTAGVFCISQKGAKLPKTTAKKTTKKTKKA